MDAHIYDGSLFPDPEDLKSLLENLGAHHVDVEDHVAGGLLPRPEGDYLLRAVVISAVVRLTITLPLAVPHSARRGVKLFLYGVNLAAPATPRVSGVMHDTVNRVGFEASHFFDPRDCELAEAFKLTLEGACLLASAALTPLLRVAFSGSDPEAEAERVAFALTALDPEPPGELLHVYRILPD